MKYIKEEKALFSERAADILGQLYDDQFTLEQQEQILRLALAKVKAEILCRPSADCIIRAGEHDYRLSMVCKRFPMVGQLVMADREDFLVIPGVGPKTLEKVYTRLKEMSYSPHWYP